MTRNPLLHYALNRHVGLERTNPVHVVGKLLTDLRPQFAADPGQTVRQFSCLLDLLYRDGLRLPRFYLEELRCCGCLEGDLLPADRPRVVGLMVDLNNSDNSLVLPLRLGQSTHPNLQGYPFTHDDLLDALAGLVRALHLPCALPERLCFHGENPVGIKPDGDSMHIAGLLAALDALTQHRHPRLEGACALIEPRLDGSLMPVGHVAAKLAAFQRENNRGSLLICHPDSEISPSSRNRFERVWEVNHYSQLVECLEAEHPSLLEPLLQQTQVSAREWELLIHRLHRLNHTDYRYLEAVDLGRRLLACSPAPAVRDGVVQQIAAAHRHLGEFDEAEQRGQQLYEAVRARGDSISDDEEADAAVEYLASFYDGHRFQQIVDALTPWQARILADRRRFRLLTRVKVFNTLGRAEVILGLSGWEDNFRRSLALQRDLDPEQAPRTSSSLVHGLLRQHRLDEAHRELETVGSLDEVANNWSQGALKASRAELARQRGESWTDPRMEDWGAEDPPPNHVLAFYHQAVARQPGCQNAPCRLRLAGKLCRSEVATNLRNVTYLFALCFELAAAGAAKCVEDWEGTCRRIRDYLQGDAVIREHYAAAVSSLPAGPSWPAAEMLLGRVPHL